MGWTVKTDAIMYTPVLPIDSAKEWKDFVIKNESMRNVLLQLTHTSFKWENFACWRWKWWIRWNTEIHPRQIPRHRKILLSNRDSKIFRCSNEHDASHYENGLTRIKLYSQKRYYRRIPGHRPCNNDLEFYCWWSCCPVLCSIQKGKSRSLSRKYDWFRQMNWWFQPRKSRRILTHAKFDGEPV